MKRFLAIFLLPVICLCGCKADEVSINISAMSFLCKVEREASKYEIFFETDKDLNSVSATVKNLNDMKYTFNNGTVSTEYLGIKTSKSIKEIVNDDIVLILYEAILDFNGKKAKKSDSNYLYDGKIHENYYFVSVSPSGLPLGIEIKDKGIKAEFANLTLVK